MTSEQKDQTVEVLRFANDYRKEMAKIRIKSFYTFHTCQLSCFRQANKNSHDCVLDCERDLDDFHKFLKENKPAEREAYYYGRKLYPQEQQHDYEKKCRTMSLKLSDFTAGLHRRLEQLLGGYRKRK